MDKDFTKRLIAGLDVATPKWRRAEYTMKDIDSLTSTTPVPCVVKPVASGSSIGVFIAHTKKELYAALVKGLEFGGQCVLEQYIKGREIQVGILAGKALPPSRSSPAMGSMIMKINTSRAQPKRSVRRRSLRSGKKP